MDKIIIASCQSKVSEKCLGTHEIWYSSLHKSKKRNGGIYKCKPCARREQALNGTSTQILDTDINYFNEVKNEPQAYMLGIIAGDGCVHRYQFRVVSHPLDIETLELFQKEISPSAKITNYKSTNCCYIDISSVKLCADICELLKIAPGKKCDVISLPDLKPDLTWHFIRGLMDSDGSIDDLLTSKRTNPHCSYASKSERIKDQIKALCDAEGIHYTSDDISLAFSGQYAVKFLDRIYNNAKVKLDRKYKRYQIIKTWVSGQGTPTRPRKVRKDKGLIKGPKFLSEEGRAGIIASNKRRKNKP